MTRRRDLEHHRESLGEIREIMSSMKTLAYMETRKLSRFLSAQQRVVESIEAAAADFLSFHPGILPETGESTRVFVLIGSERGFCGDFNRALVEKAEAERRREDSRRPRLLAVGHKLHSLLERDADAAAFVEGASVAEEVPAVLQLLIDELDALQAEVGALSLFGIYHATDGIRVSRLLPPFEGMPQSPPAEADPPVLNVSPAEFLLELIDQYLPAALNHLLYTSLMVESQRRMTHLESAVRHLDEETEELTRRCRILRQEEIIEEIEVILLSASSLDGDPGLLSRSRRSPNRRSGAGER